MSEDKNNILFNIQQGLKIGKGQYNQHGKFYFRSAADILAAAKEPA